MRTRLLAIPIVLAWALLAAAQKVESIGPLTDTSASPAVRDALEAKGYRVSLADGPFCDIWLRKQVPTTDKPEGSNRLYPQLARSAFLGVIVFPKGAKDFRGQGVKPGAYTLRYEIQPADGDHLGTAPSRDFALLVPLGADKDPATAYTFEQLVDASRQASGTRHPAPFYLTQPEGTDLPKVWEDFEGHVNFAAPLAKPGGGAIPFAIVIKGEAQQ